MNLLFLEIHFKLGKPNIIDKKNVKVTCIIVPQQVFNFVILEAINVKEANAYIMKSNFANCYVVIFNVSFIEFLARCSPFSISGYIEEVSCVVFWKFGVVFMIAPDTSYFEGLLIVVGSNGGE